MNDEKDRGQFLDIAEKWLPRDRESYGIPLIQRLLPTLFQLKLLEDARRRAFMDKYAVEIDPDKVEKEKVGSKGGKPTSDPNVNIPLDPDKGSEPFEREETREKK
jgi:hypothetical protein